MQAVSHKRGTPRREGLASYLRNHPHPGGIVVLERQRAIYMKACRTAGTSILRGAFERKMRVESFQCKDHRNRFQAWLSQITDQDLHHYRIFTFVRNPWDRVVSIARYFRLDVRDFARNYQKLFASNPTLARHALPLHQYCYLNGARFADFIGRFEHLQRDFNAVCDLLKLERCPLPHENRSNRTAYRNYFDDETRDLVRDLYRTDIELFGYEF